MTPDSMSFGRPFKAYNTDKRVWLASAFRVEIIRDGIEKAGSINRLARELGYRSRIHPGWSIRQILVGEQPFPFEKLVKLSDYVGYPIDDVLRYRTEPERVTVNSTNEALRKYGLWCYHVARLRLR
jgi:transposase-like protein